MAGAVNSKVDFASGTDVKFGGGNLGAYATLINRGLFFDALVMANFLNVNYVHSTLLTSTAGMLKLRWSRRRRLPLLLWRLWGAAHMRSSADYQGTVRCTGADGWFAEPLATIDAVWTRFNNFDLPNVGCRHRINTNNVDVRGRLGGRVGKLVRTTGTVGSRA